MNARALRIAELKEHIGESVVVKGWLYHARRSGKVQFLMVRDGSGLCQAVLEKREETADIFEEMKHLGQESSLMVKGVVRREERGVGGCELAVSEVKVVHKSEGYPITPKAHGSEFLLKHRHLHLRSQRQWALARIRHTVIGAIRDYFNGNGYTLVDTPIFSSAAGEGEQTLFRVNYFGEQVALAQTGQLYLEAAAMSLGRVYCFGPTFRAEKSKTRRHLTEFWMVEPEIAYIDFEELLEIAEKFVCHVVQTVLQERRQELKMLERDTTALEKIQAPFVRLSYDDTVDLLHSDKVKAYLDEELASKTQLAWDLEEQLAQCNEEQRAAKKQWQKDKLAAQITATREQLAELCEKIERIPLHKELAENFAWGRDLGGSDETIISCLYDKPVFVHRYPREVKAFYMKQDPGDERLVLNMDCLAPEGYGEIIGGSMREDDYEALLGRIRAEDYNEEDYQWYLDLRRYGSVPHGGFGLGVERTVGWIAGIKHVRETIAFPRMMGKIVP